jgi:hypothetical protein
LHSNFYEEWLSHASVEEGLKDVAQFAARLERLLPSAA